jgi:hypothetical protein
MANTRSDAASRHDADSFHMGALVRMTCWGIGASATLFLAVLAGLSDPGASRIDGAVAVLTGKAEARVAAPAAPIAPRRIIESPSNWETQRLSEQIDRLRDDRDRLLERLSAVEHNLHDVTGSIKRQDATRATSKTAPRVDDASTTPPAIWSTVPQLTVNWSQPVARPARSEQVASTPTEATNRMRAAPPPSQPIPSASRAESAAPAKSQAQPASPPQQLQSTGQRIAAVGKPQLGDAGPHGVDLGGAASLDRLRVLWNTVRAGQGHLLNGLHPLAHAREGNHGARTDIRLLVGPLATAEEAQKLCAVLIGSGQFCAPAVFHGQRMPLR